MPEPKKRTYESQTTGLNGLKLVPETNQGQEERKHKRGNKYEELPQDVKQTIVSRIINTVKDL
ncbi:MAG: hypothetical protein HGA53_05130 [Anaerolineaceae bacterium]|nr:hypothetical protein [Anaerolineaceae bacterium]NTV36317.1 hypothetical protein [Anaerolineaceae bacterium]